MSDQDTKRVRNLRRRVNRARNFPVNTCPASRHLHMMADALAVGQRYDMFESEPQHCAETMYAVLESLWTLRALLARVDPVGEEKRRVKMLKATNKMLVKAGLKPIEVLTVIQEGE